MKEWIAENRAFASVLAAVITTLAGMSAMLWIVWQVQYQITESISESEIRLETRLRAEIADSESRLRIEMTRVEDRISKLEDRMSQLEDKFDALQQSLDARLDQVELEQAEQRGIIAGMQR